METTQNKTVALGKDTLVVSRFHHQDNGATASGSLGLEAPGFARVAKDRSFQRSIVYSLQEEAEATGRYVQKTTF